MRLSPEKLLDLFRPHGFRLNGPEVRKGGISFVRESSVNTLYDHILIHASNPVYAETAISGASFTTCHRFVSEQDKRLRERLVSKWPFATRLTSASDASRWQARLLENAVQCSNQTASERGPILCTRLQPVFYAVHAYRQQLGDVFSIFDRENQFVNQVAADERQEVERMATLGRRMLYLISDDCLLASLAIIRFGAYVEGREKPFAGIRPHRDVDLGARLILLTDFIHRKRLEYSDGRAG